MNWLEELQIWHLCLIVFVTQFLFIFLRTMNVIYTAEQNLLGAKATSALVHLCWLLSIAIGVKSVMYLDWVVIVFSIAGGLIGTHYGIKLKQKLSKQ